MGQDTRTVQICDEDVLNIQNAVEELKALAKTDNQKDYLEIITLVSICNDYKVALPVKTARDEKLEMSEAIRALANAAEKVSEQSFVMQPFLGVFKRHGKTIMEAEKLVEDTKQAGQSAPVRR